MGANGLTPSFAIGTVTTGVPGSSAAVTIREIQSNNLKGGFINE